MIKKLYEIKILVPLLILMGQNSTICNFKVAYFRQRLCDFQSIKYSPSESFQMNQVIRSNNGCYIIRRQYNSKRKISQILGPGRQWK